MHEQEKYVVNVSAEFEAWWHIQHDDLKVAVAAHVRLLRSYGPGLGRPYADHIKGSKMPNLKELRIQHEGRPYRVLFAFDPVREALLLIAGDKGGNKRWYIENIPRAERIFAQYVAALEDRND